MRDFFEAIGALLRTIAYIVLFWIIMVMIFQ